MSAVDYQLFLKSEKIEEKMLAILENLNNKSPGLILKQILLDINGKTVDELLADRYVKQLHVLVGLESSGLVLANVAFKRCKDAATLLRTVCSASPSASAISLLV